MIKVALKLNTIITLFTNQMSLILP